MNWFPVILGAAVSFLICLGLHSLDIDRIEAKQKEALASQIQYDLRQCDADKQITKGVADDIEKQRNALSDQLTALKLRHKSRIVMPSTGRAISPDDPGKQNINVGTNGLSTDWLYDFAGQGTTYQNTVTNWQDFYSKVKAANPQ